MTRLIADLSEGDLDGGLTYTENGTRYVWTYYRERYMHAARLLHCIQKTQPVFEFTAQSVAPRL